MNHVPRPASLSTSHPDLHQFSVWVEQSAANPFLLQSTDAREAGVRIFRWADQNTARLTMEPPLFCGAVHLNFNAEQLKELARMCIDAAHDLETFPATVVTEGEPS